MDSRPELLLNIAYTGTVKYKLHPWDGVLHDCQLRTTAPDLLS